jgi:hypothetical protein
MRCDCYRRSHLRHEVPCTPAYLIPVASQVNAAPTRRVAIADEESDKDAYLDTANTLSRLLIHLSQQLMGRAIRLCLLCLL